MVWRENKTPHVKREGVGNSIMPFVYGQATVQVGAVPVQATSTVPL
jgi:hypothetical protein